MKLEHGRQALSEVPSRTGNWIFAPQRTSDGRRLARRNTSIGGLSFAVEFEGEHIPMRISENALRTVFGAGRSQATWLLTYRDNAERIDARAIAMHSQDPDRPVFLQTTDFETVTA